MKNPPVRTSLGQCGAQTKAMGGLGVGRGDSRGVDLHFIDSWDQGRRLTLRQCLNIEYIVAILTVAIYTKYIVNTYGV